LKIGSLESQKIIIRFLELEKIGSLESENLVPTGPYRVPNIFLKKKLNQAFIFLVEDEYYTK